MYLTEIQWDLIRCFIDLFLYDQLNLNKRTTNPVDMLHDVELQDVKISHTQTMLLIRLSRRLFLFSTKTDRKLRSIEKVPDGIFIGIWFIKSLACFSFIDAFNFEDSSYQVIFYLWNAILNILNKKKNWQHTKKRILHRMMNWLWRLDTLTSVSGMLLREILWDFCIQVSHQWPSCSHHQLLTKRSLYSKIIPFRYVLDVKKELFS